MLLVIIGESGSGKDTLAEKLMEEQGFKKVVKYTTRPKRLLEVDHVDYHFINGKQFKMELLDKNKLLHHEIYNDWHYGFTLDGVDYEGENFLVILTPTEFEQLRKKVGEKNVKSIYLEVHERERLIRLAKRGDNIDELMRRIIADRDDFKAVRHSVEIVIREDNFEEMYRKVKHVIKGSEPNYEKKTNW